MGCGIAPLKENNIFLRAIKEAPFLPPRYSHALISPSVACMGGREDCVPGAVPPVLFSFSVPSGFMKPVVIVLLSHKGGTGAQRDSQSRSVVDSDSGFQPQQPLLPPVSPAPLSLAG